MRECDVAHNEVLRPPPSLHIDERRSIPCDAGVDARPLTKMANLAIHMYDFL